MPELKILVDSTADLSLSDRQEYDIDYLHMSFYLDKKIYDASLDWEEIRPEDYYALMDQGHRSFTGQASLNEITTKFEQALSQGKDVLYIGCSSMLSGTINNARIVACDFIDKYDNKIVIIDSLRSNYAQGMMAIKAAKLYQEGHTLGEIVHVLLRDRLRYQTLCFLDSLEWMKKSGRIKSSFMLKNLIGFHSLVFSDSEGYNSLFRSTKTKKGALSMLADIIYQRVDKKSGDPIYIEHGDCINEAHKLAVLLKNKGIKNPIQISYLGPIIGATTGPESLTISFYGKKVSNVDFL
ncbi:DegV family protein [Treponema rectale]|uniref:DegV family protein n=1 Tax=Treponema rectale TaxID=744512 RepID=A0A7M1XJ07_9SPIR|nr:DegV family protein [Treponema rectale]